jgi:hypothetical protein
MRQVWTTRAVLIIGTVLLAASVLFALIQS